MRAWIFYDCLASTAQTTIQVILQKTKIIKDDLGDWLKGETESKVLFPMDDVSNVELKEPWGGMEGQNGLGLKEREGILEKGGVIIGWKWSPGKGIPNFSSHIRWSLSLMVWNSMRLDCRCRDWLVLTWLLFHLMWICNQEHCMLKMNSTLRLPGRKTLSLNLVHTWSPQQLGFPTCRPHICL